MRHVLLTILGCVFGFAQPLKENARDLVLTQSVDAGVPTIHLRNTYDAAATAWVVGCESDSVEKGTLKWHWTNQNLSLDGKPLGPGQETALRISPFPTSVGPVKGKGSCDKFRLMAAVFADGTVTGDLKWISATVAEERRVYQDIAKATDLLKKSVTQGTARPEVIQQLVEWHRAGLREGMPQQPSPGSTMVYGVSSGAPVRPSVSTLVPGAALWLIQEQGKDVPESIQLLADWQGRIGPMGRMPEVRELPSGAGRPRTALAPAPVSGMVGKSAPDIRLKDLDGHEFALKELRGKTVFVNFWATWCEPCRAEMPQIQALHDQFKDKGLVVIGINYSEPAETAKKYFSEGKYTIGNLLDPKSEAFEMFGGGSIPKIVLIDKDGIVRYFQQGYSSRQDFLGEVKKLGL